ncbi:DUF1611 domain-containing protein [Stenotrophobium rhamnosiphilum]|uniref:DUF1611 domain-containing protein n=1 Tax=Stenotrophobium rhamnosiphilum TaxID=2029166 RepID=A0A2T5MKK2_9GAMM|nr:DUF1611 domain-containing protein [Stenotrophobium rhamnosiphilum]PTU33088.1 DUF1611 domain-containing protein [Stenotrophobium rhamnosiphilum]
MSVASKFETTVTLRTPYLLFLGEADFDARAKTAFGLRDWAPKLCLGQIRLPACKVTLGLPDMTPAAAAIAGAGSLVIGVAPKGGQIAENWIPTLRLAIDAGLDIVSGMHDSLEDIPGLAEAAKARGVRLINVRNPPLDLPTGTGRKRTGKRLLTVGTDCALGKKYTALAIANAMRAQGIDADFRATGQTGIMIAGRGLPMDAVVADFSAGAAECLSPDAAPDHWDIVEGQGALFHPAYAGVTLGLLHGSQPDALVLCHDPAISRIKSLPVFPTPSLEVAAARYLEAGALTNPAIRLVGVSLITENMDEVTRQRVLGDAEQRLGVPAFDPLKTSLQPVIDRMLGR